MQFAAAVATFETQLQANQRSRHTVKSYLRDLAMLRRWLEREEHMLDVEAITPTLLLQFAASPACTHQESGAPRQRSTIDKIKMSVRAIIGFLHDTALIPTNPARVLKYRRGRERVPETLTEDECLRLLEALTGAHEARDATILALFLHTGVRLDAHASIDVDDVRIEESRLVVRHMKGGNETTKAMRGRSPRCGLRSWRSSRDELPRGLRRLKRRSGSWQRLGLIRSRPRRRWHCLTRCGRCWSQANVRGSSDS